MKHTTTLSNATVLGVAPMAKTLPVVGGVLIALFVAVKPEATAGLGLPERLLFWCVHIGLGLASIVLASVLLRRLYTRSLPLAVSLLVTGLAGAAMLAPLYVLLEQLVPAGSDIPDSWLDHLALSSPAAAVLVEFAEVVPVFLTAWFATNLPLLLARVVAQDSGPDTPSGGPDDGGQSAGGTPPVTPPAFEDATSRFFDSIPRALGTDVIAVSSDMHYLHIHTTKGKCMILGTLRDASHALSGCGQMVHRSHWVAHDHVRRLIRRGSSWECFMSNDLHIPVSRRNHANVKRWYSEVGNVVSLKKSHKAG